MDNSPLLASPCDAYDRVSQAIAHMQEHHLHQPPLSELADVMGLSPTHAQRVFQRWAGISPKRFLQYLTADHAQSLLACGTQSLMDTAWDVGLSGPSRLHDLFVSVHAMTPAQWKKRGTTLPLKYGIAPTPLGHAWLASTPYGLCELHFGTLQELHEISAQARQRWPGATWTEDPSHAAHIAAHIFQSAPFEGGLSLHLKGTNFQIKVWRALLDIPPQSALSYGQVATYIGSPKSARAVGTAVGSNLVGYAVPCHRVLRASGEFHNYRWGRARKQAALVLDMCRSPDTAQVHIKE